MGVKDRVDLIADNTHLSLDMLPTTCKIELTGRCTLQCKFCYNQVLRKTNERQTLMTDALFDIILERLKQLGSIKEVGLFYMGESLLHPSLTKYYKRLKEEGYFTYLTTNGTILGNLLETIPYIDSLKISWNYKDEQDFVDKTGMSKTLYQTIINNIHTIYDKCKELGKSLAISTVLDSNKEDYSNALSQLVYDEHYWLPLQTQGGLTDGTNGVVGEYDKQFSPIPCWSLFKGLYIDVNGNIRCCCYGHKDCHIIGNIQLDNLEDVILSSKIQTMRNKHLHNIIPNECKECLR